MNEEKELNKNGTEAIRKAKMYLEWLIEALEKEDGEDEN